MSQTIPSTLYVPAVIALGTIPGLPFLHLNNLCVPRVIPSTITIRSSCLPGIKHLKVKMVELEHLEPSSSGHMHVGLIQSTLYNHVATLCLMQPVAAGEQVTITYSDPMLPHTRTREDLW